MKLFLATLGLAILQASPCLCAESFYKNPSLFSTRPSETKSLNSIDRFGPVGMGLDLIQPAFTMRIKNIEEGSPAAATGKLEKGQIIESINGQTLEDIDPRMQLADILGAAEATDGILEFRIKGMAEPVVVKLPVLGAYSETWPLDCPKSDKIVRATADYLASPEGNRGISDIGMIFLLSTGNARDLEVVGEWARNATGHNTYAWYLGFSGIPLCEYYLRTGDPEVLPNIQRWVNDAVAGQYNDGWAGRGGVPRVTYGNGHLNAAGTSVVTFLLLAKECGADVPDRALLGALRHFYRYAGRGGNPYGDNRPEVGFVDNGKNGALAFAMAAAAGLTPDGENSVYAAARDVCAKTALYTTSFMLHGHTGGGIGEIWRSASMGLLRDRQPRQYRDFMDSRRWHYELSRRHNGAFGILGGGGYDHEKWGAAYGWAYTVPRKKLRIFGAPPTEFSKPYKLPEQVWGTEADNDFLSLDAVPDADGSEQDLSDETLAEDSGMQFIRRFHGSGEISDDVIRQHIHHQDAVIRQIAAAKVLGVNRGYIGWKAPGGEVRPELMMEFLTSPSPRVRRAMFSAVATNMEESALPREVFELAIQALSNDLESWWVKDAALHVVGLAQADWVAPEVRLLLSYLDHSDWWLQNAALRALTPVVADERCYQTVLPAIGELVRTNQRAALTLGLLPPIRQQIRQATPEVQQLAVETLRETYSNYAGVKTAPGGQDIESTLDAHLEYIASSLADVPGGLDALYEIARQHYPEQILPHKGFFLNADPSQFGPKLKKAITPIIEDELIPEYVGRNRTKLADLAASEVQNSRCGGAGDAIHGLVALYERAGHDEYGWQDLGGIRESEWFYHSFDPIPAEQVPLDRLVWRYREVTLPDGMEGWFKQEFDPAAAGWKLGRAPFGQYGGKIPESIVSKCSPSCTGPTCYGATDIHTLWENEVLLLRQTVEVPPLKEGHRYRLRVNHRAHVGNGGGFKVWINGEPLIEREQGIGRGGGEKPYGAYITREWFDEFDEGELTIAAMSFLRYNDKYKTKPTNPLPQGRISIHLEEQKLPPMGDDLVRRSARVVPMLSTEWQNAQDSESSEERDDAPLYRWDGEFVPNPTLMARWELVGQIEVIEEFDPEKPQRARRPAFTEITLKNDGRTDDPIRLWTGNVLMGLDRYEALRMRPKTIGGKDYLFIETGGFSNRHKPGWESPWLVFQRK